VNPRPSVRDNTKLRRANWGGEMKIQETHTKKAVPSSGNLQTPPVIIISHAFVRTHTHTHIHPYGSMQSVLMPPRKKNTDLPNFYNDDNDDAADDDERAPSQRRVCTQTIKKGKGKRNYACSGEMSHAVQIQMLFLRENPQCPVYRYRWKISELVMQSGRMWVVRVCVDAR
jgi:hypothetical protein